MWKQLGAAFSLIGALLASVGACAVSRDQPSWTPPSLSEVRAGLEGLSWREFAEASYRLYVLRFPETVTRMGMAGALGVRNDRLNDYSDAYLRETMEIEAEILGRLRAFDRASLPPAEQVAYDACAWYWDDLVRAHPFVYCDYPVSHLFVTSLDQLVFELLTEIHPLATAADAEDYVSRLEEVGTQFDGILDALDRRAAAGVVVPQRVIDWAAYGMRSLAYGPAPSSPYLVRLSDALPGIAGLSPERIDALRGRAEAAVRDVVQPAYGRLLSKLSDLRRQAPEIGLWRVPNGLAYYEHLLRHFTGLDLGVADVHDLGLGEVARIQTEIRSCAALLGYPAESLTMAALFAAVERDGGTLVGEEILREFERLIDQAALDALAFLPALPSTDVVVHPDPVGGFYRSAPRDGSAPATFGALTAGTQPRFTMPTLAFHETIPGHHVQIALAQQMDLPLLLLENPFLGFTEGWALYAERLAAEAGWYADDPIGNLGRLQFELMRAARLAVDTGIHAIGWSYDQAVVWYQEATGRSSQLAQQDVTRYAAWPGQAVSYAVGYLELLELRETARAALGDRFDLTAFHQAVLARGNVPLCVLAGAVAEWIATSASGSASP